MRPAARVVVCCVVILSWWGAFPPTTVAQTDVIEDTEARRAQRQLEIEKAIRDAATEAEARTGLETKAEVTYEQILQDPDNLELNFRYAKSQVARGDFVGASATLERILMIQPDFSPVRLFYAQVLYRLDNLEDAEREFRRLREATLPEVQRRQVAAALRTIGRRRRRTTFTGSVSIGWGFDTNRNAAPSSKHRLSSDQIVDLTGASRKRRDTHLLAVSRLGVAHDLGTQTNHQLIGSLDYFLGEQTRADDLDLQSFAAEAGLVLKTPLAELTPTGFASHLSLSRETFLRSQGVNLRGDRPIGDRLGIHAEGGWAREDFSGTNENPTAAQRSGSRVGVEVGGRYGLTPRMQLGLDLEYAHKDVSDDHEFHAYEGFTLAGSHTWLLGNGQFLLSSLAYTVNSYERPDPAVSASKRLDRQLRSRLTYGLPVSLLAQGWLPEVVLRGLTAAFSVEQFRSLSTLTNYTYSNTKLGLTFTKRVEF